MSCQSINYHRKILKDYIRSAIPWSPGFLGDRKTREPGKIILRDEQGTNKFKPHMMSIYIKSKLYSVQHSRTALFIVTPHAKMSAK